MRKSLKTRLFLGCLVFALLSSCASQSHVKCTKQNWFQEGYVSALEGKERQLPDYLQQECEENTDKNKEFFQGFDRGLEVFCSTQNGFRWGSSAQNIYLDTCPQDKGFEKAYLLAKQVRGLRQRIDELARDAESQITQEEKTRLEQEIFSLSSEIQVKMKAYGQLLKN